MKFKFRQQKYNRSLTHWEIWLFVVVAYAYVLIYCYKSWQDAPHTNYYFLCHCLSNWIILDSNFTPWRKIRTF